MSGTGVCKLMKKRERARFVARKSCSDALFMTCMTVLISFDVGSSITIAAHWALKGASSRSSTLRRPSRHPGKSDLLRRICKLHFLVKRYLFPLPLYERQPKSKFLTFYHEIVQHDGGHCVPRWNHPRHRKDRHQQDDGQWNRQARLRHLPRNRLRK